MSEPAFPTKCEDGVHYLGMTLRDYFAAQALPTCISLAQHRDGLWDEISAATAAYAVADAMLEARRAGKTGMKMILAEIGGTTE